MDKHPDVLYKTLVISFTLLLIVSVAPIGAINSIILNRGSEPIDIPVDWAWELLNDISNGIQIPVDVRTKEEWDTGYIDTPWPECPIWYEMALFEDPDGLADFIEMYNGEEIILHCNGGSRSLFVAYILNDSGFNGTIYNMVGGIIAWKEQGYPIRNNTQPDAPDINGLSSGGAGVELAYFFTTDDAEKDGMYYWVDWNDSTIPEWIGPFAHDKEITLNHTWETKGTYLIKAKVKDFYDNESDWTELEITIPRDRAKGFNLLEWLFERFPMLERLLILLR